MTAITADGRLCYVTNAQSRHLSGQCSSYLMLGNKGTDLCALGIYSTKAATALGDNVHKAAAVTIEPPLAPILLMLYSLEVPCRLQREKYFGSYLCALPCKWAGGEPE